MMNEEAWGAPLDLRCPMPISAESRCNLSEGQVDWIFWLVDTYRHRKHLSPSWSQEFLEKVQLFFLTNPRMPVRRPHPGNTVSYIWQRVQSLGWDSVCKLNAQVSFFVKVAWHRNPTRACAVAIDGTPWTHQRWQSSSHRFCPWGL